jgi:hypothetical protein
MAAVDVQVADATPVGEVVAVDTPAEIAGKLKPSL